MDFSTVCRTCLSTTNLNPIFVNPEEYERYAIAIYATTGLKVAIDDGLPQKMCSDCVTFVNNSVKFRQHCKHVEAYLLSLKNDSVQPLNIPTKQEDYHESSCFEIELKTEDASSNDIINPSAIKDFPNNEKSTVHESNDNSMITELHDAKVNGQKITCSKPIQRTELQYNKVHDENGTELPYNKVNDENAKMQRVTCKLCSKNLSIRSVDYHMHKNHPGADKRKVKCDLCDSFIITNKLERHKSIMHGAGARCAYCKLDFHDGESLIEHLTKCTLKNKSRKVSQSGRAMTECDVCHKSMQKASIRMHKKIKHAGLGPVCEHCGRKFANKLRLKEHLRARHGFQKIKCSYCEFESASSMAIRNHERRHRGEKPFICEFCGAKFHAAYLLAQHKQSHRTEYLYKKNDPVSPKSPSPASRPKSPLNRHDRPQNMPDTAPACLDLPNTFNEDEIPDNGSEMPLIGLDNELLDVECNNIDEIMNMEVTEIYLKQDIDSFVNLENDLVENDSTTKSKITKNEEKEDIEDVNNSLNDGISSLFEGQISNFEWSDNPENFRSQEEIFNIKTGSVFKHSSAYDAFRSYWSDDILDFIVNETNKNAAKITTPTFKSQWYDTNSHEILCLFAFWIMLGIIKMPTIKSCFSVEPLLKTEVFRRIFTQARYFRLSKAVSFFDSSLPNDLNPSENSTQSLEKSHELIKITTHLNSKFQSNYVLDKDICIDECLTSWKGNTGAFKSGIKTYQLCESKTGYLWSFIVDIGKKDVSLDRQLLEVKRISIVKELINPLLNKGHKLFLNEKFSSLPLARFLKQNGTDCVGTLNPLKVPDLITKPELKRGESIEMHSGDVAILSYRAQQTGKLLTMLSTCHNTTFSSQSQTSTPSKPQILLDYNKSMKGVDLKEQMLEPYLLDRKGVKNLPMKFFKHLLNISIHNSQILLQSSNQKSYDRLLFRLQLVQSILDNHLSKVIKVNASSNTRCSLQPDRILNHNHWPVHIEPTASCAARNRQSRRRCNVCYREGKVSKTPYKCESCGVALCVENCFKVYHTT